MITPRLVWLLGLSQLLCWGSSYYLIGVLGERIAADLGWSSTLTYSGFSVALVVMGLVSPLVGRLIDRNGGRNVMALGSIVLALRCVSGSNSLIDSIVSPKKSNRAGAGAPAGGGAWLGTA